MCILIIIRDFPIIWWATNEVSWHVSEGWTAGQVENWTGGQLDRWTGDHSAERQAKHVSGFNYVITLVGVGRWGAQTWYGMFWKTCENAQFAFVQQKGAIKFCVCLAACFDCIRFDWNGVIRCQNVYSKWVIFGLPQFFN